MKTISATELKQWENEHRKYLLLDVREDWERSAFHIGGLHIPSSDIYSRKTELPTDTAIIIYCEKGIRSQIIIQRLEAAGFDNLYNLTGGMKAWKETNES